VNQSKILFTLLSIVLLSGGVISADNAFAAEVSIVSAKITSDTTVEIVFDVPVPWSSVSFDNLIIDGKTKEITGPSGFTPNTTVIVNFDTGIPFGTDATGTINVGPIGDAGQGNYFPLTNDYPLTDGQSTGAPVITLHKTTSPTNDNPVVFKVDFGESINESTFRPTDIEASSGDVEIVDGDIDGIFFFAVENPTDNDTLTVQIGVGLVSDVAGNLNSAASNLLSVDIDRTDPTITSVTPLTGTTISSGFSVGFTNSEDLSSIHH